MNKKNTLLYFRGESGIRTRDTLLAYTRFPGVPLQPLEHLSTKNGRLFFKKRVQITKYLLHPNQIGKKFLSKIIDFY